MIDWTSIEDTLPADGARVLVTAWRRNRVLIQDKNGEPDVDAAEEYDTFSATYQDGAFTLDVCDHWECEEVIAWAPRPDPYYEG